MPIYECRCQSCAYLKSTKTIHEGYKPSSMIPSMDYFEEPRNIGRRDVEMPESVKETIEAARQGEVPKELDI